MITVGRLKEKYWQEACKEYIKRLCAFCKIEIIELAQVRLPDNPKEKQIDLALEQEGKNICKILDENEGYNIVLCIEGTLVSSDELSKKMDSCAVNGYSQINFIIGSSFGISQKVKEKCDYKLSMSKMTFPHQLARVILLEQIYRSFQISNHTKYHK